MRWKCVPGVEKGWPRALETFHYTSPTEYNCTCPKIPPSPLQFPIQFNLPSSTSPPAAPPWFQLMSGATPRDRAQDRRRKTDPPGSSPRPAAWYRSFQGSKQIEAAHPKKSAIGKRNLPSLGQRKELNFLSLHDLGQNHASVSPVCFCLKPKMGSS